MYDCFEYSLIIRKLKLTDHAIMRYYSRTPENKAAEIGKLRKLVARALYDHLKIGCPAENAEIKVQVTEQLRAVIVPDNGWVVKSFVPEEKEKELV